MAIRVAWPFGQGQSHLSSPLFSIPDSRFPIPDSLLPTPYSLLPTAEVAVKAPTANRPNRVVGSGTVAGAPS
nr:hypothetical protein [Moorena sp. SIO3I6]